jgi:hypothetical protein
VTAVTHAILNTCSLCKCTSDADMATIVAQEIGSSVGAGAGTVETKRAYSY